MTRWNHHDIFGPMNDVGRPQWRSDWGKRMSDKNLKREPCPHCGHKMRHGQCAWCEPGDESC